VNRGPPTPQKGDQTLENERRTALRQRDIIWLVRGRLYSLCHGFRIILFRKSHL